MKERQTLNQEVLGLIHTGTECVLKEDTLTHNITGLVVPAEKVTEILLTGMLKLNFKQKQ